MNKPWQICLVLVLIFLAGGVSGGLVAFKVARSILPPPPRDWVARQFERVTHELELTPEQQAKIQPIIQRRMDEVNRLRREAFKSGREIMTRMEAEVAAVLTPAQREKYERILKERQESLRRFQEQRGLRSERRPEDRPPGERPPPPPPGENPPGS
jgi:hypothetical protein